MTEKKLIIKLTEDQQKQIKDATGQSIKELNMALTAAGSLTEKELQNISGGWVVWYKR